MILQSLNALSLAEGADPEILSNLTSQLAQITITCDRLMESLLHISDQRAQIQRIQDMHIASALAMALRKLNSSYGKRVTELKGERARIEEMKAELKEAWDVAQELAQEMDDLDNFHSGFSDDEAEADSADPRSPSSPHPPPLHDDAPLDAELMDAAGGGAETKTTEGDPVIGAGDYSNRVSAARKRSTRASKASLRRTKGANGDRVSIGSISRRKSQSKGPRQQSAAEGENVPEVPILTVEKAASIHEKSYLEITETRPVSPASVRARPDAMPPLPPKSNLSPLLGNGEGERTYCELTCIVVLTQLRVSRPT